VESQNWGVSWVGLAAIAQSEARFVFVELGGILASAAQYSSKSHQNMHSKFRKPQNIGGQINILLTERIFAYDILSRSHGTSASGRDP
jgi:hypothetical protein